MAEKEVRRLVLPEKEAAREDDRGDPEPGIPGDEHEEGQAKPGRGHPRRRPGQSGQRGHGEDRQDPPRRGSG